LTSARRTDEDAERMYANGPERISPTAGRPVGGGLTAPSSAADHGGDPRSGPHRDARNCAGAGARRCGAFAGDADRP
jgi:hypothetical protein